MTMIRSDFHTHTNFVDGKNTPEEMVQAAIGMGLAEIGISEHSFVPFDPGCSMSREATRRYRAEMARLKEKYAGQIAVYCGIELDADSPDSPDAYDYAIGSVHYLTVGGKNYSVDLSPEETRRLVGEAFGGDASAYAEAYFEKLTAFILKTEVQIVGHFDLPTKFRASGAAPDEAAPRYIAAWNAAVSALAGRAVFEINTGAISRGYRQTPYPSHDILRALSNAGGSILLSGDAHRSADICGAFGEAETLARSCGFTGAGFTDRHGRRHIQF